jgi:uncharacterized protein (TIGR02246 family)
MLVALSVILTGVTWVYAQQRGGQPMLTGEDIAEIERLYARYSQGLDFQDEELYLSAWADDAVFTTGGGEAWAGKERLRERFRLKPGGEGTTTTHNNTSILVWMDDDGVVHGRGYWIVFDTSQEREPKMVFAGHYFDTFRKTPEGWRIQTRGSKRGWNWRVEDSQ